MGSCAADGLTKYRQTLEYWCLRLIRLFCEEEKICLKEQIVSNWTHCDARIGLPCIEKTVSPDFACLSIDIGVFGSTFGVIRFKLIDFWNLLTGVLKVALEGRWLSEIAISSFAKDIIARGPSLTFGDEADRLREWSGEAVKDSPSNWSLRPNRVFVTIDILFIAFKPPAFGFSLNSVGQFKFGSEFDVTLRVLRPSPFVSSKKNLRLIQQCF